MNKTEYLLTCISEEAGEVAQIIGKSQRFGLYSFKRDTNTMNIEELRKEVHDVIATWQMLCEHLGSDSSISGTLIDIKKARVEHFMESSRKHGHLQD